MINNANAAETIWYKIHNDNKMIKNEKSNVKADANAADANWNKAR